MVPTSDTSLDFLTNQKAKPMQYLICKWHILWFLAQKIINTCCEILIHVVTLSHC
jgi:hypothetical protein